MKSRTIITDNAIINGTYALIKNHAKYLPPVEIEKDNSLSHDSRTIRIIYRRLFRLRPFISNRRMVRETYTEYIRYKFKIENYALKRSIIFCEPSSSCLRDELYNSLAFVTKAVCYLPETREKRWAMARDNTVCRQVLKNILTMEFEKDSEIAKNRKGSKNSYLDYKVEYNHIKNTTANPTFKLLGEFDICLMHLNEMLQTRL